MAELALVSEGGTGRDDKRVVAAMPLRIGRSADADWRVAVDDPLVSRIHAVVRAEGESLVVEDQSANGLFVNDEAQPLGAGNARRLAPGDRIRMGEHVFRVTRADGTSPSAERAGAAGGGWFDDHPPAANSAAAEAEPQGNDWFDADWLSDKALGPASHPGDPARRRPAAPSRPALEQRPLPVSPAAERTAPPPSTDNPFAEFIEPEPASPIAAEPPAPAPTAPTPPAPHPQAEPATELPAAAATDADTEARLIAAFLRGAGLERRAIGDVEVEALLEAAGGRLRELAFGVTQLLRARAEFKDAARIARTQIRSTGNNPLKLAVSPEEAVSAVLLGRDQAYLSPEAAVHSAFDDLRDHELRMLEAIQAALNSLLARFDPVNFEAELDQASRLATLVAGGRRSRCWELFRERFEAMSTEARNRFLGEIGPAFAAAYEAEGGHREPPSVKRRSR
jgi:type VI secretion system FHA domain protein